MEGKPAPSREEEGRALKGTRATQLPVQTVFEGEPRFVICILHGTFKCDTLREGPSLGNGVTTDSGVGRWLWPFAFEVTVLLFQMVFTQGGRGFLIATPSTLDPSLVISQSSQIRSRKGQEPLFPPLCSKMLLIIVLGQRSDLGEGHSVTEQERALVCQLATPSLQGETVTCRETVTSKLSR